eukprot:756811-Hanusia_phi.AAC.8
MDRSEGRARGPGNRERPGPGSRGGPVRAAGRGPVTRCTVPYRVCGRPAAPAARRRGRDLPPALRPEPSTAGTVHGYPAQCRADGVNSR